MLRLFGLLQVLQGGQDLPCFLGYTSAWANAWDPLYLLHFLIPLFTFLFFFFFLSLFPCLASSHFTLFHFFSVCLVILLVKFLFNELYITQMSFIMTFFMCIPYLVPSFLSHVSANSYPPLCLSVDVYKQRSLIRVACRSMGTCQ